MRYKVSGMFTSVVNADDRQHAELEVLNQLQGTKIYIIDVEEVKDEDISRVCNGMYRDIDSSSSVGK